jgi:tRNA threonylcarbamoyladenosine biosynthesis protein TsaE
MALINSLDDMHEFGSAVAKKLSAGDLLLLSGPLGSGKTAFTQGVGKALGIENITSPTFVISKIYKGSPNLVHVDAYRLQGSADALFDDLDLESYLPSSITVVEWGEGFVERLAPKYLEIKFSHGIGENQRLVELVDHGTGIKL